MLNTLAALGRLAATPAQQVGEGTVLAACGLVKDVLGAEDAYVIRAGDPNFVRLGSTEDPRAYEIKQRGYWLVWREGAANPALPGGLFSVTDRMVVDAHPLEAGTPATHVATLLPGNESNSEVLIVRGPWPEGLSGDQVDLVASIRPLLAYLVGNVLDAERQERQRSQLSALADVAESFSRSDNVNEVLTGLSTALAKASGYAWVAITLTDPAIEHVTDRALNVGRHSETTIAEQGRTGNMGPTAIERDLRVARHLAWTRMPWLVPDVFDPNEQMLVDDSLRGYYQQAHILSMACFPMFFRDQLLGSVTFCASETHSFEEQEVGFLGALVSQASNSVTAFRLNRELREAEAQLRAVFASSPALITVIQPDGTITLSEGASVPRAVSAGTALAGKSVFDVLPPGIAEATRGHVARCLAGEAFCANSSTYGREYETQFAPLRDDSGVPVAVITVTMDVTERVHAERELRTLNEALRTAKERAEELARVAENSRRRAEYLASHDALTGVLSRRAWFELAESRRPSAIAIFDVDSFKTINDTCGHPGGDVVLRAVAERITEAVDSIGTVGRLGGEEFAVLFLGPVAEAEAAAQRAVERVAAEPVTLPGGDSLRVTVSGGLAPCRRQTDTPAVTLARAYDLADRALYSAKAAGRRQLVVSNRAA
ncbi:MAG: diguanylate cyclase [Dehalococcoidia bacterium]|nr:diguanylate cyclase [Dehalococcoidia bacterium]